MRARRSGAKAGALAWVDCLAGAAGCASATPESRTSVNERRAGFFIVAILACGHMRSYGCVWASGGGILADAMRTGQLLLLSIIGCHALWGQGAMRGLVDAHVHYNGDKAFLEKMVARLDPFDGTALILTPPK